MLQPSSPKTRVEERDKNVALNLSVIEGHKTYHVEPYTEKFLKGTHM